MKQLIAIALSVLLGAAPILAAASQLDPAATATADQTPGLMRVLSNRPFFGTAPVLTLNGDYVNSPREDFEELGVWTVPLTLDEMHGVIGQVAFGEAKKQGDWQLAYKWKLMTMDSSWQAFADANRGLTLSDRRTQVLKANYNLRDWWQLGVSAFTEDRLDTDDGLDVVPFGLDKNQSLGFQIETTLRF